MAFAETHFANAFDFDAFVPYFALKAAGSAARSALHAFAAFSVAWFCACERAFAFCETQRPKAFLPLCPEP